MSPLVRFLAFLLIAALLLNICYNDKKTISPNTAHPLGFSEDGQPLFQRPGTVRTPPQTSVFKDGELIASELVGLNAKSAYSRSRLRDQFTEVPSPRSRYAPSNGFSGHWSDTVSFEGAQLKLLGSDTSREIELRPYISKPRLAAVVQNPISEQTILFAEGEVRKTGAAPRIFYVDKDLTLLDSVEWPGTSQISEVMSGYGCFSAGCPAYSHVDLYPIGDRIFAISTGYPVVREQRGIHELVAGKWIKLKGGNLFPDVRFSPDGCRIAYVELSYLGDKAGVLELCD